MKVLWLTNYALPYIAEKVGMEKIVNEGWLITLSKELLKKVDGMVFCTICTKEDIHYQEDGIGFYGISVKEKNKYCENLSEKFRKILIEENPDIIHIMGSEFPHSYSMFEACEFLGMEKRCVVSMQGLISKIAKSYDIGIEDGNKKVRVLWDRIIKDSIILNKKDFEYRGNYEEKLLKKIPFVMGRTEWDYMCIKQLNPRVHYFKCNEILRESFYKKRWKYENCQKHSIIISQATYPVKGFHILLKAVAMLTAKYPQIKVYVPSNTMYEKAYKRNRFLNSDYVNYVVKIIKDNHLQDNIEFLGALDEEKMCEAYLKSNVFVSASTIENSSNSLGEAMSLGMPIVSSYVGGVTSMMEHGKEGLFYPVHEEYLLAAYIDMLFEKKELATEMGKKAMTRALEIYDIDRNIADVVNCYMRIQERNA